jgi:hypothetical protein
MGLQCYEEERRMFSAGGASHSMGEEHMAEETGTPFVNCGDLQQALTVTCFVNCRLRAQPSPKPRRP